MTDTTRAARAPWEIRLEEELPLLGHRNWIVVADAAYPAQVSPGIETITAAGPHVAVLRTVSQSIHATAHVRAKIYTDQEVAFVAEPDAPGITAYRQELGTLFAAAARSELPHDDIIARLDSAARLFRVLILKTTMNLPYTSVFFELDCGYWHAEAENRLRTAIAAHTRGH